MVLMLLGLWPIARILNGLYARSVGESARGPGPAGGSNFHVLRHLFNWCIEHSLVVESSKVVRFATMASSASVGRANHIYTPASALSPGGFVLPADGEHMRIGRWATVIACL